MPGVVSSWRTYVEETDDDDDDEERAAARLSLMMCPQFSAVCRWRVFNAFAGFAIITAPLRLHLRKRVAVKDPRGCSFVFFLGIVFKIAKVAILKWRSSSIDRKYLAKFGYKPNYEVQIFYYPSIFWPTLLKN
jgi:hypothetical protein